MLDHVVVRVALSIYILFAGVALILLWRNSAAPDGLKNAGILLASILPVLIVILPYLNKEKVEKDFTFIIFYDSKEKVVTFGNDYNPYGQSYIHMFTNLSKIPSSLRADNISDLTHSRKGLNIIEKGIIGAMLLKFSNHWDIEQKKFEGPISTSESWSYNSKLKTTSVPLSKITEIFPKNPLITPEVLGPFQLNIPLDCNIKVEDKNRSRAIIFDNPYVTLRIAYRYSSSGVAQQGVWGVLPSDSTNMNRYYVVEYRIDATLFIKSTKVYSPKMKKYKNWFENICGILANYDWNVVDKKIEKSLGRDAISKTLATRS